MTKDKKNTGSNSSTTKPNAPKIEIRNSCAQDALEVKMMSGITQNTASNNTGQQTSGTKKPTK